MTKGEELLNKKIFNAEDILGTKVINSEGIFDDYVKTTSEEQEQELKENELEELITNNFNQNENNINKEQFDTDEFFGKSVDQLLAGFEYDEEKYYELLESSDFQDLKIYTESENYPENYPGIEELVKLKLKYGDLLFIKIGNYFEEFNYQISSDIFITTTLKSYDYFFFRNNFGTDENIALFYPFIIGRCCLFPQIKEADVLDMPAGTVKQLADSILKNSKYQISCTVNKL